jgi:hypothetical protein
MYILIDSNTQLFIIAAGLAFGSMLAVMMVSVTAAQIRQCNKTISRMRAELEAAELKSRMELKLADIAAKTSAQFMAEQPAVAIQVQRKSRRKSTKLSPAGNKVGKHAPAAASPRHRSG